MQELFKRVTESLPNISWKFVEKEEYNREQKLEARSTMAQSMKRTLT